jgi:predicted DNA-binding protein (MmcQ/YjbR family)
VTPSRLRRLCLAMPGAEEVVRWGGSHVLKAGGRMVATLSPAAGALRPAAIKASPESVHLLTETGLFMPAPCLARAWHLIVARLPKRLRASLLAAATARPGRR